MTAPRPLPAITDKAAWLRWFEQATKEDREKLSMRRKAFLNE
jgi:hypothetical protein